MNRFWLCVALVLAAVAMLPAAQAQAHPQLHKGCARTATQAPLLGHFYVGAGHVGCPTARRIARRAVRRSILPRGWHCTGSFDSYGTCTRGNRIVHWIGSE